MYWAATAQHPDERVRHDQELPDGAVGVENGLHDTCRSSGERRAERTPDRRGHSLHPMPPRITVTVESSSTPVR